MLKFSPFVTSPKTWLENLWSLEFFDTINTPKIPAKHPFMSVAARIRFQQSESGQHSFGFSIFNPDRKDVVPPLTGDVNVRIPPGGDSGTANLVFNLAGVQFGLFGKHFITLTLDGQELGTIPFYVKQQQ